jgi:metal-sulfur cluster biosynthetic enzyme
MTDATRVTPDQVMDVLTEVYDPELHLNIVDLGLVYDIDIGDAGDVKVVFTLTTPACPLGPMLDINIKDRVMQMPGVNDVETEIVFTPPWDPRTMASDEIKMQLGIW